MTRKKFGFVFGETFIERGRVRGGPRSYPGRLSVFFLFGGGLLVLILGRLLQLQVVEGNENRLRSEENRILVERIAAPRGAIFDREGEVLTRNVPIYRKEVGDDKYQTIDREEAEKMRAEGKEVIELVGREYIYGASVAHVLGYLGEISKEELLASGGYGAGEYVGKIGIEKLFESRLRGVSGGNIIERDASGEVVRELSVRGTLSGEEVRLTIDIGLQRVAFEAMEGKKGAVVVTDPATSEVLALVSSPGFDPHDIPGALNDEDQPIFNRALLGLYPPGSVFKIVTSVAALEEEKIDSSTEIEDTGEIKVGEFRYGNWYFDQYGKTEGVLDLVGALKRSNDIFFYKAGEWVGAEKIAEWSEKFGLGDVTGLELGSEAEGVVAGPEWKERVKGERWFLGNTYHISIGQGDLQVTPMQMHQAISVMANDGKLCRPRITNQGLQVMNQCEDLGISGETLDLVKRGMVEACRPKGTAFDFFEFKPEVACKTGTAQFGDPQDRTHAWFTAFGPAGGEASAEDPEILVTVLLEKGGEGSKDAAPVAKKVMEYWFNERK